MGKKRTGLNRANKRTGVNDTLQSCKLLIDAIGNGGGISRELARAFEENNFSGIVSHKFDHATYDASSVDRFQEDYLLYNLLRKFPDLPGVNFDRRAAALTAMRDAEEKCKRTNRELFEKASRPELNSDFAMVLYHARRKIASCLGVFDWGPVIDSCDFGPGASTRLPRKRSDLYFKLQGNLHLTSQCVPLFQAFQNYKPGVFEGYEIVHGNKIVTVPKDAKTDRPIAIEPCFNMFVQKGIGSVMRRRLLRHTKERIDLNDQTINQRLAFIASLGHGLATIDLSSASDTVSRAVVELLLPEDWHAALTLVRSSWGSLDGTAMYYSKFSSMGNGYTFELESLLFWALAKACIEVFGNGSEYVSVYGDDIVISSSLYTSFLWVLSEFGFIPNERKSFGSGFFYESCGKHYFAGRDVTPVYVDKVPRRLSERVSLCNELILLASRLGTGYRDSRVLPCLNSQIALLPKWLQVPRAPVSHKGNALIGDFDEVLPRRAGSQKCGFYIQGIVTVTKTVPVPSYECGTRKSLYNLGKIGVNKWGFQEHQQCTPFTHLSIASKYDRRKLGLYKPGLLDLDVTGGTWAGPQPHSFESPWNLDFQRSVVRWAGIVDRTLTSYELKVFDVVKSKKNIFVAGSEWSYLGPWI